MDDKGQSPFLATQQHPPKKKKRKQQQQQPWKLLMPCACIAHTQTDTNTDTASRVHTRLNQCGCVAVAAGVAVAECRHQNTHKTDGRVSNCVCGGRMRGKRKRAAVTAYTRHAPRPPPLFPLLFSCLHPDDDCRNLLNENWSSFFGIKLPALMDERTHTDPLTQSRGTHTQSSSSSNNSRQHHQHQQATAATTTTPATTSESSQHVGAFCGDSHLFRRFRVSKFNLCILYVCCCCCCGYATPATQTTATRSAYAAYGCWQRRRRRRLPILQLLLLRLALLACCLQPVPAPRSQSAVENCKFRKIDFLVVIFGYARMLRVFNILNLLCFLLLLFLISLISVQYTQTHTHTCECMQACACTNNMHTVKLTSVSFFLLVCRFYLSNGIYKMHFNFACVCFFC